MRTDFDNAEGASTFLWSIVSSVQDTERTVTASVYNFMISHYWATVHVYWTVSHVLQGSERTGTGIRCAFRPPSGRERFAPATP